MIVFALALALITAPIRPDPVMTPGVANPAVTQANISTTVCKSGWTKTVRPSVSYTNKLKLQQMAAMGLPGKPSDYEEDHFWSLQVGGSPTDPHNLWPEKYAPPCGARLKDQAEDAEKRAICSGKITLAQAQQELRSDWVKAYNLRVGPLACPAP